MVGKILLFGQKELISSIFRVPSVIILSHFSGKRTKLQRKGRQDTQVEGSNLLQFRKEIDIYASFI